MTVPTIRHIHTIHDSLAVQGFLLRSVQSVAFNTSLTIDSSLGEFVLVGLLTNNITINAPTNPFFGVKAGQVLGIYLPQDTTGGRTITYNAVFKTGGAAAIVTTLSTATLDVFFNDGTNWRILSRITGQAL